MEGNTIGAELSQGLTAAPQFITSPKRVRIDSVANGFTVNLEGGKRKTDRTFESNTHVAKDGEEALQIAKDFLAKE